MSEAWVVNASPLILFSRIDRLDLIEDLTPAILVPNAVVEEVRTGQRQQRWNGQGNTASKISQLRPASSTGILG